MHPIATRIEDWSSYRQPKCPMTTKNKPDYSRKVTAKDVAAKAGVSKWTVSRAFTAGASISPDSLKRVIKAAEELGYRPNLLARSLSKKRSNIVGVVVDEFSNPNVLVVMDQVTRQLQLKGYSTMLLNINAGHSYEPALLLADQFQVDAVLFLGSVIPDDFVHLIQEIRHIPLIVLYRDSNIPGLHVFNTDDYHAGLEIAELFLKQGYQRMGYMAGPPPGSTLLERVTGFRAGLQRQNLDLQVVLKAGNYMRRQGYEAMTEYLRSSSAQDRVEAIFCENDNLAIGALDALRDWYQPADIAIVGFDDIELAASPSYNLTSYRQPFEVLAKEAIGKLENKEYERPERYLARGTLVLRMSHLRRK